MKFGKFIQSHSITEWSLQYINYKYLKKIINSATGSTNPNPSTDIVTAKQEFLARLENEKDKVNMFYARKESELKSRLQSLKDKANIIVKRRGRQYGNVTIKSLRFALADFVNEMDKLQKYVEMNDTGFKKIIKKWDKYSKSSMAREVSLTNQIEVELCFNAAALTELSDSAAACIEQLHNLNLDETSFDEDFGSDYEFGGDEHLDTQFALILMQAKSTEDEKTSHFISKNKQYVSLEFFKEKILFCLCSRSDATLLAVETLLSLQLSEVPRQPDFNYKDPSTEKTCLHTLAENGNLSLMKYLIEKGADPKLTDLNERSPLHYAAMTGHYNCINYLVSLGSIDINLSDRNGMTSLLFTVEKNFVASSKLLIEHGASAFQPETALLRAIDYKNIDIVNMVLNSPLLDKQQMLNTPSQAGLFPIHAACHKGCVDIVKVLLNYSNDNEIERLDGYSNWTPIFYAASENQIACAKFLLENQASINRCDESGWSVLDYASWYGNVDILKQLKNIPKALDSKPAVSTDLDDIPLISLPPPLLALFARKYIGFNTQIQIRFGHHLGKDLKNPGIQIFNASSKTFKIVMTQRPLNSKNEVGLDSSISTVHPSQEEKEIFKFVTDYNSQGCMIEFELLHTFGRSVLGKAVMIPRINQSTQTFVTGSNVLGVNGVQHISLPILDQKLTCIGLLNVEVFLSDPLTVDFPTKEHSYGTSSCPDYSVQLLSSILSNQESKLNTLFESLERGKGIMLNLEFPYFILRGNSNTLSISEFVDETLTMIFDRFKKSRVQWNLILTSGNPIVCQLLSLKQPAFPVMFDATKSETEFSPYEASRFSSSAGIFGIILDEGQVVGFPNIVKAVKEKSLVLAVHANSNSIENIRQWDVDGFLSGNNYHHFINIFS